MAVFLPDSPEFLKKNLVRSLAVAKKPSGRLCTDTLNDARLELRARFLPNGQALPIVLTGHQPVFYHPGIFIKDLLADAIARSFGGVALNMVVDTDEAEIAFEYPFPGELAPGGRSALRRRFVISPPAGMLREQRLPAETRSAFVAELHAALPRMKELFGPEQAPAVVRGLELVCRSAANAESVMDPAVRFRESFESSLGLSLRTLYTSDLIRTPAFLYFARFVIEHADEFRRCYNSALADYREQHGIKNAAQPLPDLEPGELPFWKLEGSRRVALRADGVDAGADIFPKAIALTLFCRLFVCDLFIHGRGGARYDVITDRVLADFFECPGAPFTVASATLALSPTDGFPAESRPIAEIERDIRSVRFEPTRFLGPEHPLYQEWRALIEERKRPGADLRRMHSDFLRLKEKALPLISDVPPRLEDERARAALATRNREVFLDRTFPFFFYDTGSLFEAVRPYGPSNWAPTTPAARSALV